MRKKTTNNKNKVSRKVTPKGTITVPRNEWVELTRENKKLHSTLVRIQAALSKVVA